jgi:hypothetical protein
MRAACLVSSSSEAPEVARGGKALSFTMLQSGNAANLADCCPHQCAQRRVSGVKSWRRFLSTTSM